MIEAHQRSSFGESVALNDSESQSSPELLVIMIERGSAADDCPELPSKSGMNAAKAPPAPDEVLMARLLHFYAQCRFPNPGAQLHFKQLPHRAE